MLYWLGGKACSEKPPGRRRTLRRERTCMKKITLLLMLAVMTAGCATRSFDTFDARSNAYDTNNITLAAVNGLFGK